MKRKSLFAILPLLAILASCAPEEAKQAREGKYGGVVRFAWSAGPVRPNFILRRSGPGGIIRDLHWGRLYSIGADGGVIPSLATGHTVSDDGLVYTVNLRRDALWHDGVPFTSADVVFFHEYAPLARDASIDAFTPPPSDFRVVALDDFTVQFILERPNPFFAWQHQFVEYMILPKHIWQDIDPAQWDYITDLDVLGVGIGPFRLVELRMDEFARFERFDDFWGGRPYLDGFVYQFIPDTTSRMAAFESGQLDHFIGITRAFYSSQKDNPRFGFEFLPSGLMTLMLVNHNDARIGDLAVRQALAYIMDRDSIRTLTEGFSAPMLSAITSSDTFYNPAAADASAFEFSIEKAIQVLEQAGWMPGADGIREKNGRRLDFEILSSQTPNYEMMGVLAMDSARRAGIRLNVRFVDAALWSERVFVLQDFDLAFNGMIMGPTPAGYRDMYSKGNFTTFVNDEVAELFTRVDVATSEEEIQTLMDQIQYVITRERAAIWLWEGVQGISWTNGLNVSEAGISGLYERWNHVGRMFFE
ncbi:MAG: ABC transporter substrate-binding protein [Treponema sp.]|nr:ABC transporter substrate-binding protein [Treponema sp.]